MNINYMNIRVVLEMDQIQILRQIQGKFSKCRVQLLVVFIDIKQAYDTVKRDQLYRATMELRTINNFQ